MSQSIFITSILVVVTNIIVEVIKKLTWDKIPTNILAIVVSLSVTLCAFFAYVSYSEITVVWYYVVAAVVQGIFVAYAAMFGFDKLKETLSQIETMRGDE